MEEDFKFSQFLMEQGFTYTNYGDHNLYEIDKHDQNYAVNILGDVFNSHSSLGGEPLIDQPHPKNEEEAKAWFSKFTAKPTKAQLQKAEEQHSLPLVNMPLKK